MAVTVTDQTAHCVTAVLSGVKVVAEPISTRPLVVFNHPLTDVLHTLANNESTAQSVRETLSAHVLLRGNACARIVRDGGGEVRELWPIAPGTIHAERPRPGGPLVFHVSETGAALETLRTDHVWRMPAARGTARRTSTTWRSPGSPSASR